MASLTVSSPGFWSFLASFPMRRSASRHVRTDMTDAPDDARARRAFIQEMLTRNPAAFSSELDVHNMMHMYPGRF